jgi:hypothetical protein
MPTHTTTRSYCITRLRDEDEGREQEEGYVIGVRHPQTHMHHRHTYLGLELLGMQVNLGPDKAGVCELAQGNGLQGSQLFILVDGGHTDDDAWLRERGREGGNQPRRGPRLF